MKFLLYFVELELSKHNGDYIHSGCFLNLLTSRNSEINAGRAMVILVFTAYQMAACFLSVATLKMTPPRISAAPRINVKRMDSPRKMQPNMAATMG